MIELTEYITKNIGILFYIFVSIVLYVIGYIIGHLKTLDEEIKLENYDKLVEENKKLNDIIKIKKNK